jgi:hypothetical protein
MAVQTVALAAPSPLFDCALHQHGPIADGPHVEELAGCNAVRWSGRTSAQKF